MTVFQARPFRSVSLETVAGEPRVIKRFHHPDPWRAALDGIRARREFRAHRTLHALGLPVPRALDLQRTPRGWELHLALVPQAHALEELLQGAAPPRGWEPLLTALGRLLAELQNAGFAHGDLHPLNVLVDAAGEPWLIDLQRLRRTPRAPHEVLSELVECAAFSRERVEPRARMRCLAAWRKQLVPTLHPRLAGTVLAAAVEHRARRRRAERVRIGLGRWLRDSSRAYSVRSKEGRLWERRGLEPAHEEWLVLRGAREELRARWLGAARLHEHGIPVAQPARIALEAKHAWAAFELPMAGRRAATRAELQALLADRGLALRHPAWSERDGCYFLPPREPADFVLAV